MGVGLYPTFDPAVPSAVFDVEGKLLLDVFEPLDRVAVRHGLKPISSFGDNRDIPVGFDGTPDDLDEALGPWNDWFPTAEGLRTVEGLIAALRSDPEGIEMPGEVIDELAELARALREAEKHGARFRLEIA